MRLIPIPIPIPMADRISIPMGIPLIPIPMHIYSFYQLRRLRQIIRLVGQAVAAQLVSAFILSRLDYCNSVLAGLPRCTTEPLQRVLNGAARFVFLQQLHWLPIDYRITYKPCLNAPRAY